MNLTNIRMPNTLKTIGSHAFESCGFTQIEIPNGVTDIESDVFYYCTGLTSVAIPNSVKSIGEGAFNYCSGLTNVTIGSGVTNIGYSAFNGCSGLTSMTFLGKTLAQVQGMANYSWEVDPSIIQVG